MISFRIPPHAGAALLALVSSAAWSQNAPYSVAARFEVLGYEQNIPWAAADTHMLVMGDINADGIPELVSAVPGFWSTISVSVSGVFSFAPHQQGGVSSGIAAANFNGDGAGDLAIGYGDKVLIKYGNGANDFNPGPEVALGSVGPNSRVTDVAAADFNLDGFIDIAAVDTDPLNDTRNYPIGNGLIYHRNSIALLRGTLGGGAVADPARPRLDAPQFPLRTRVEDFNGDGRPELLVENNSTVNLLFNPSAGGFASTYQSLFPGGNPAHVDVIATASGKFNADNRRDLAAIVTYTNTPPPGAVYRVHLFKNVDHPTLPFALAADLNEIALPYPATSIVVTDFNGDTYSDIIVGLEAAGTKTLAFYAGHNDFTFDPPLYYNGGFDAGAMAVADFNNDSKPDIAVVDCTGGAYVMLRHD
jgi:hypothetical protein